jgi:predicted RNA-binding Zn-ribbon protein involved in translation (DUF1610 family)
MKPTTTLPPTYNANHMNCPKCGSNDVRDTEEKVSEEGTETIHQCNECGETIYP